MRVVFAGTPQFAVPTLRRLVEAGYEVVGVYTQPDRPAGRGRRVVASPVKLAAKEYGLCVVQPQSLRTAHAAVDLNKFAADVMVVVAYGLILPESVLATPRYGCVNVHASLLPRWRGAAPIARALQAGDAGTGITIMLMDAGVDTGPVLATRRLEIGVQHNGATLHDVLAQAGAELLVETLPKYVSGELQPMAQDERGATLAPKVSKAEGRIDWHRSATEIQNQIRAFLPWPVAYTFRDTDRIRILCASVVQDSDGGVGPGTVRAAGRQGIEVVCGQGVLALERLQRDNGRPLPAGDFINGYPLRRGDRLG